MKKFLACALALVMLCGLACAAEYEIPAEYVGDNVIYLIGDETKGENGPFNDDAATLATYTAVKFTIQLDPTEAAGSEACDGTWVGGGVGFNSESTGWESHEWTPQPYALDADGNPVDADGDGTPEPVKELTPVKVSEGVYEVTFSRADGSSIFKDTDTYAQIWLQDWSTGNAKLVGATLINDAADDGAADDGAADDGATDSQPETGDATSIVLLAGVAVLAMVGVVASKKRA